MASSPQEESCAPFNQIAFTLGRTLAVFQDISSRRPNCGTTHRARKEIMDQVIYCLEWRRRLGDKQSGKNTSLLHEEISRDSIEKIAECLRANSSVVRGSPECTFLEAWQDAVRDGICIISICIWSFSGVRSGAA